MTEGDALREFADAMSRAASAARQIAMMRNDPQWIAVENAVAGARTHALELAQRKSSDIILPKYMERMLS